MNNLIKSLKKSILFEGVSSNNLEKILSFVDYRLIDLEKEDILFDSYTSTDLIGIILYGKIFVEKILPCGKEVLVFHKSTGELFGEVAAFSNAEQYPCNVIAKTKCQVILFKKSELLKMLSCDTQILNNFLYLISSKALYLNHKVESLSYTSVKQRIVHSLIKDFDRNEKICKVTIPFSKKVWASKLNISRSSLYRELESLYNECLIEMESNNTIKILDIDRLYSILMD